jgi:serine/threonine protein kinase/tetratricopeptide (TPR) repeat protein
MSDSIHEQGESTDDVPDVLAALSDVQQSMLTELLDEYLRRLENGERADPADLTVDHPDLQEVFARYVAKLDAIHGFVSEVRSPDSCQPGMIEDSQGVCRLGEYEIVREIGRGGMGTVYEARQSAPDRSVALKLLPMTATFDSRQVARFKNEANAAGRLNHPNIVPIYSIGSSQRIHYYSMQLIDGLSIDQWIEKQPNQQAVDWQQAVQWTIEIAGAIQCAHESGIVHRDVKPSNLLLDQAGRIWITDFGLASCQTSAALTQSGDMLGTLRYMSPEQAAGKREQVDHRTDIYSLAATLFEMLTLQPAVPGDDATTLLRQLEQADLVSLIGVRSDLPADLSVVLQMAMAKRKDDRYESADYFACDLQAVLENRPTIAQPPSKAELVHRFASRHRKMVAAVASMLAIVFMLVTISSLIIWQQNQDILGHKSRADRNFDRARSTVDQLGSTVAQRLASVPGAEHVRQKLLRDTLDYYQQFIAEATADRELQAEIAATHTKVGCLIAELESPEQAIPHFRRAAECFADISNDVFIDSEIQRLIANNANHLGLALAADGREIESMSAYRQAISLHTELARLQPADVSLSIELASMQNNLGLLHRQLGQRNEARLLFSKTIELLEKLGDDQSIDALRSRSLAAALSNLSSLSLESDPRESSRLLQQAIEQRLAFVDRSPNRLRASSEIATMYGNLGSARLGSNNLVEAADAFEAAIGLQRQLHSIAPKVHAHRRDLAMSLNNLAMVKQKQSNPAGAAKLLEEAVSLQQDLIASSQNNARDLKRLGAMEHNHAVAISGLNKDRQAVELFVNAIQHQRSAMAVSTVEQQSESYLRQHYLALLRLHVRRGHWTEMRATEVALRETARGDEQVLDQIESQIRSVRNEQTRNQPKSVVMVRP